MKILAAVVTYNRKTLLERCFLALKEQTYKTFEILVIDNGSTDGTSEWLHSNGISYITQENSGGAGGFYRAVDEALHRNFDWIWCMDDDGFPEQTALSELVPYCSPDTACINSLVVSEQDRSRICFHLPYVRNGNPVLRSPMKSMEEFMKNSPDGRTLPFGSFFNGTLISLEYARKAGNIKKEFFIWGDEVEYAWRMMKYGKVITVFSALHFHPMPASPVPDWKLYYGLRNTIYINNHTLNYSFIRNIRTLLKFLIRFIRNKNLLLFFKAAADGFGGKLGRI